MTDDDDFYARPKGTRMERAEPIRKSRTANGTVTKYFLDVVLTFEDKDECLAWPFCKSEGRANIKWEGKMMSACRLACILKHGPPPTKKHEAAHSCGRGHLGCVNPHHLSWKTHKENSDDRYAHGTMIVGDQHKNAKLTDALVVHVWELRAAGRSHSAIGKAVGVSKATIWKILTGQIWTHVGAPQ